jgi:hypothetical protein
MANGGARKVVKPVAAAAVTLGTIASIWWFALKPRRKSKDVSTSVRPAPEQDGVSHDGRGQE